MAELDTRTQLLTGHTNQPDIVTNPGIYSVKVSATAGQFKLTVDGDQTADIAYNAAASAVKSALVATGAVEADQVDVTGGPGDASGSAPYVVTIYDVENFDEPTLTVANGTTPLSGGTGASVTVTQAPTVQAANQTEVVLDPNSDEAVQTPIAQQTGVVGRAGDPDPSTVLGLND